MHDPARRKVSIKFVIGPVAVIVLIVIVVQIFWAPSFDQSKMASCCLAGYTNISATNMVLLEVTNRSRYRFVCFVEPPMIVTKNGELKLKDVYPAANPVFMPPHSAITYYVLCPTDTNQLYVRFDLEETEFGSPHWKLAVIKLLRSTGLPVFKPKSCQIASPPFGKGQ